MVVVEIDEPGSGPIWIHAEFRFKELCRLVPGSKYIADRTLWRVPLSWASCKALRGIFGLDLQIGPNLTKWAQDEYLERIWPCLQLRSALDAEGSDDLYSFQRAGVHFLDISRRSILADEMGTGKTVQIAALLRMLIARGEEIFPMLIVAPNSVKTHWRREVLKRNPELDVQILAGGAAARRKQILGVTDVCIVNWETTWRHSRLAPYGSIRMTDVEKQAKELNRVKWKTVVVDEAHRMKNPKSKQTRATWWIGHQASVDRRYALTGTPIANTPDDLWSILHFLEPNEWPSRTQFVERYCLQAWNPYGGLSVIGVRPEMREEFYSVLDPRMRRMPKDLVLPFLPPKLRTIRETEMTTKQEKAYKEMDKNMIAELGDDGMIAVTLPITKNLRLMQFSSAYAELNDAGEVRLSMPSNKVDELLDTLEEIGTEPVVVFAQSRQLIMLAAEALARENISYRLIVGGMTDSQRDQSISDFQEGRVRVILLTIQAGGEGITLTRARHVIFMQRSWSMLGNKQAEDRVHRIGSEVHDHIAVIDFVTPGTVEEPQIEKLIAKMERLEEIVRDRITLANNAAALAQLDAEEQAILNGEV